MAEPEFVQLLQEALEHRFPLLDPRHETALRLFNGFTEGCPQIAIDLYADTLVIHNYADTPEMGVPLVRTAQEVLLKRLPWLRAAVLKTRSASSLQERHGQLLFGAAPAQKILENGVWYAIELGMQRDAGFYLDTRNLRRWETERLDGKTVLNAFAYTGSLGVAALAGGAIRVVQLDRTRRFLDVARRSAKLNRFSGPAHELVQADFFRRTGEFRRRQEEFDCVIIDPPFFATSSTGMVDQERGGASLLNKVRPLVSDGGYLVAVNNALYVSGAQYMATLEGLCADGYMRIEELIAVPDDVRGYLSKPPAAALPDPAPFNHSTKIAVLKIRRKASQAAQSA